MYFVQSIAASNSKVSEIIIYRRQKGK